MIVQFLGRDPGEKHFAVSIIKSSIRLLGCALSIAFQSISILAVSLLVAELFGIYEEIE